MGLSARHPRPDLLALVEGRLDEAARARVARHLALCLACQAEAAQLMHVADILGALPQALRPLTASPAGAWSHVWARVQGAPIRPGVPQLNLYLSLAAVLFVLAAALPAGWAALPLAATAGVIQTPEAVLATPIAGKGTAASWASVSTALAAVRPVTAARPIPIQTPIPGQKG